MKRKEYLISLLLMTMFYFLGNMFPLEGKVQEKLQLADSDLESYSISLSVKDIQASYDFYKNLGFEAMEGQGSIAAKWLLLHNGSSKIGLFEGFFPQNTITFNPKDGRKIYDQLVENGIEGMKLAGFDKEEGPCTFTLFDPDMNPMLFDQHQ